MSKPRDRSPVHTGGDWMDPARIARAVRALSVDEAFKPRAVVRRTGDGVAFVAGLVDGAYEELVQFDSGALGMAFDLRSDLVGVILLSGDDRVCAGQAASGTGRLPDLAVGHDLCGRVIDPLGNPLDGGDAPAVHDRVELFRKALPLIERKPVDQPLLTGVFVIDSSIPIGRGQRELIIGDRNVGKTALAEDIVMAQRRTDVICVYVVVGQPMSRVLGLRAGLHERNALAHTIIVAADASTTAGMRYLAPYAGASIAEWFRDRGQHALVVYDDLTKHADAYRELSLLIDRPPGREAFPGDVFYVHAELLERAAPRADAFGGGSVTALPIVETTDGDLAAYIPTNVISITDGQIYLDSRRFARSLRPAVDIGRSVSRIGGHAQPAPLREATRNLRILHARFEELESLAQVGLELEAGVERELRRGHLMRSLLRQSRWSPRGIAEQILIVRAVVDGWLDDVEPGDARECIEAWLGGLISREPELYEQLEAGRIPAVEDAGTWLDELARRVRAIPIGSQPATGTGTGTASNEPEEG